MLLSDTLDLPLGLDSERLPQPPRRIARRRPAAPSGESPLEEDLILATVPTVRGFKVLGGAALYARLGRGGMGAVYRGRHLELGIDVAVKCLLPSASAERAGCVSRFEREIALAARIDHPNVVQVLDSGTTGGLHYLVMEYVHGETLRRRVGRLGALPWEEALAIAKRAARGLGAAHRLSLVHRDIKPENLMVGRAGEVKVCDLGLVKAEGSADGLTRSLSLLGTPRYMAPEQWQRASDVGPAADVYSLGACLYFMLTGQDGLRSQDLGELRRLALEGAFPDVRKLVPGTPPELAAVLARCVARDPGQRFQSGDELSRALGGIQACDAVCLLDGGADTVPLAQRAAGPARREEVALRRALARRTNPVQALLGRVSTPMLVKLTGAVAAFGAGWVCGAA